jgi:hypothetical protein
MCDPYDTSVVFTFTAAAESKRQAPGAAHA